MGRKTVAITFREVQQLRDGFIEVLFNWKWLAMHGIDDQKPIYITPDAKQEIYYIDGWEIEDAEETKDKCVSGESEGEETSTMDSEMDFSNY